MLSPGVCLVSAHLQNDILDALGLLLAVQMLRGNLQAAVPWARCVCPSCERFHAQQGQEGDNCLQQRLLRVDGGPHLLLTAASSWKEQTAVVMLGRSSHSDV